jgi:hypothetical protein
MPVTTLERKPMDDVRRWFGWTVIIGILHMSEQLLFGLDELQELKGFAATYYGWFNNTDYATVILVTTMFSLVNLIVYALLIGGRWRLIAIGFFALVALGEIHHIVKSVMHASYFPGTVTAIPFVAFGVLLLRALVREFQSEADERLAVQTGRSYAQNHS